MGRTAARVPQWQSDALITAHAASVCPRSARALTHLAVLSLRDPSVPSAMLEIAGAGSAKSQNAVPSARDGAAIVDHLLGDNVNVNEVDGGVIPTVPHAVPTSGADAFPIAIEAAVVLAQRAVAVDPGSSVAQAILGGALFARETRDGGPLLGLEIFTAANRATTGTSQKTTDRLVPQIRHVAPIAKNTPRWTRLMIAASHLDRAVSIALEEDKSHVFIPGALADRAVIAAAVGDDKLALARAEEAVASATVLKETSPRGVPQGITDPAHASDSLGSTRGFHSDARTGSNIQAASLALSLVHIYTKRYTEAIDSLWKVLRLGGPPRGNGVLMQLLGVAHAGVEEPAKSLAAFRYVCLSSMYIIL